MVVGNKNFANINSETSTLSLPILQNYDTLSTTDRELLQKIFTFINILDVNKDANNKISVPTCIKPFYNQFILGVTNIPDTYSAIQQQLHILENRYIPTLRNVKLVDDQQTGINRGYKTMFIVPLRSSSRPETPISPSPFANYPGKEHYLRKEYNKCTIDVAFNPRKYNPEIEIHETPGSYIDPGDRTDEVDKYIPTNSETIDLTEYGLPGISFTATKQEQSELKPEFIDIVIKFDKSVGANFDNIETLKCAINRRQKLQGKIKIEFSSKESMLEFTPPNDPNIFDGNGVKNSYIPLHCNNKNRDDKIKSNVFLLGKLLGDLLQIVYVERLIPQEERNQFILFTNDLVVGVRCVMLKIPFLLSANYRKVSTSNCNVLYFYDDITAIQQFKLIIGEKQKMIETEIKSLKTFQTQQLSLSDNLYFKSYIKSNNQKENPTTIDKILSEYNSELQSLTTRVSTAIEEVTTKLETCIKDLVALDNQLDSYTSETEIPEFSRLLKIISSIKIDPQIKLSRSQYIFTNNKKFTTVKLSSTQIPLIESLVNRLSDSRILDPTTSTGRSILLKDLIQIYHYESINTVYPQMKRQFADERRIQSRLESEKKRAREQEKIQQKSPTQLKPILAKRQKGGSPDIDKIDLDLDFETENIYNIFYSYCNYHGITIIKNPLFNRLIQYIITHQQSIPIHEFELDDPIIAEIFDDAKTEINMTLQPSSPDHDIEEDDTDKNLTDPDILTSTIVEQIRENLQSTQSLSMRTPEKVSMQSLRMRTPEKVKENPIEKSSLTNTITKKSRTQSRRARGISRKASKKTNTKRNPRVHLKKTRRKSRKNKSRKNKSRKNKSRNKHRRKHRRKHTRK